MENNKKDPHSPADKDEKVISPTTAPTEKPADNQEESTVNKPAKDTQTKNTEAKSAPINNNHRQAKKSSWWIRLGVLFSLIIAIIAIAACYWLYLQLDKQGANQGQFGKNISEQAKQNQSLKYELQQISMDSNKRITALEKQQLNDTKAYSKLAELQQSSKLLQERVAVIAQRSPNHWMASEAEYLVRMAGRKLWLENDPQTAMGLLKSADERISAMKDPALTHLRKALANDISSVKALKTTDITNTIFELDTVISQLTTLPLNRVNEDFAEKSEHQPISDSVDDWQQNLARTWHDLTDGFVTIRKRTTDLEPLLSPEQQWYLVENIRNKLLQAQLSLYRFDQINYKKSIELADKWLQQYFDVSDPKTKNTIEALDKLSRVKIEKVTLNKFQATPLLQQLVTYGEIMPMEELAQ
ncbi:MULTISPECIES: uroporphyrinogen-III C-methyltransferase [Shewanella]|uniref:Uroporphyrinogen-III C-methyltransferase n=1 Tax=Shewanella metallivivens TaxID=2872342 RepID=A0ABT5TQY3_9GAMM|nr:uroporphyrinogen-III C-methyltransferase [Shewanella metallivivens]MDD8061033.1 uroporphyrinogen-III C-methyltransferase [Shewanella metallivivens]